MRRKSQPAMDFVIEGLSTGRREYSLSAVDDFTGQPLERPIEQAGRRVLPSGAMIKARQREIEQEREQAKAQRSAKALVKVITDMLDPPVHKPFKRRF